MYCDLTEAVPIVPPRPVLFESQVVQTTRPMILPSEKVLPSGKVGTVVHVGLCLVAVSFDEYVDGMLKEDSDGNPNVLYVHWSTLDGGGRVS